MSSVVPSLSSLSIETESFSPHPTLGVMTSERTAPHRVNDGVPHQILLTQELYAASRFRKASIPTSLFCGSGRIELVQVFCIAFFRPHSLSDLFDKDLDHRSYLILLVIFSQKVDDFPMSIGKGKSIPLSQVFGQILGPVVEVQKITIIINLDLFSLKIHSRHFFFPLSSLNIRFPNFEGTNSQQFETKNSLQTTHRYSKYQNQYNLTIIKSSYKK